MNYLLQHKKLFIALLLLLTLLLIATKTNALIPFIAWSVIAGTAGYFGWSVTNKISSSSGESLAVAGDLFKRFYEGLEGWLQNFYTEFF